MDLTKLKEIKFSLMKRETDVKDGKAEYTKKKTAKFQFPENFFKNTSEEEVMKDLISNMINDLKTDAPSEADTLGLWVQYDSITLDNAMSLSALDGILEYSKEPINPYYEFFMMTITN